MISSSGAMNTNILTSIVTYLSDKRKYARKACFLQTQIGYARMLSGCLISGESVRLKEIAKSARLLLLTDLEILHINLRSEVVELRVILVKKRYYWLFPYKMATFSYQTNA